MANVQKVSIMTFTELQAIKKTNDAAKRNGRRWAAEKEAKSGQSCNA